MAKNDYDVLENQIGDFGEEQPQENLGKLKHKASYGQNCVSEDMLRNLLIR